MIFRNDGTYDLLKRIALVLVPLGTFVSALANIWGLPYGDQIVATIAAVDVFIGGLVTASNNAYKKSVASETGD